MRTGKLVDRSLPQLLQDLHKSKLTGKLIVQHDADENVVYLRDGEPVQVVVPGASSLGELMVELGMLTPANHRFSLVTSPPVGQRYGFVLLRYGLVGPEVLERALIEQIQRRLAALFQLADAKYLFLEQEHGEGLILDIPLRVSPEYMIYQGLRSLEAGRLERLLQPVIDHSLILPEGDAEVLAPFQFGDEAHEVLNLLRAGSWSLRQVADTFCSVACLAVLSALHVTERLMPIMQPALEAPPPEPEGPGEEPRERRTTASRDPRLLRTDIEHFATYAAHEDPFVLLGADEAAPVAAIERNLAAALRTYDPEDVAAAGLLEVVEQARLICDSYREAARVLSDPAARVLYLRERLASRGTAAHADRESALSRSRARRFFTRGRLQLQRKAYAAAALEFAQAARALPGHGELRGLLTWSRYRAGQIEAAPALQDLQQALEVAPRSATLWYFAGVILRQAGAADKAILALQRALQIQPDLTEATTELAALGVQGPVALAVSAQSAPGIPASTATLPQSSASSGARQPASQSTQSLLEVLRQPIGSGLFGKLWQVLRSGQSTPSTVASSPETPGPPAQQQRSPSRPEE